MVRNCDDSVPARFTVTCRHCARIVIHNVGRLGDAGACALRAHLAACWAMPGGDTALGDLLVHFSVDDGDDTGSRA